MNVAQQTCKTTRPFATTTAINSGFLIVLSQLKIAETRDTLDWLWTYL